MVKIEDLKALAGDFGIDVMSDFLDTNFLKVFLINESDEYFIKRILINSLYLEKKDCNIFVSNEIGQFMGQNEFCFYAGKMLTKHFPGVDKIKFLETNTSLMSNFIEAKDNIGFIPYFKNLKSAWWMKLFLNIENPPSIFAKLIEGELVFYGVTSDIIKNTGDVSVIVVEVSQAVPVEFLKMALISVDFKVKEVVDIMPTNAGKVLYLLEIDGAYDNKDPLMALSFDFDGILFQVLKKVGGYHSEYGEKENE